jgi:hypothetical protein
MRNTSFSLHASGIHRILLEDNKLFYRPVDAEKTEGVLLYENG